MLQTANKFQPLRWPLLILLAATLVISCGNKDEKKTEMESTEIKATGETTDSLPPIDKDDSLSSTRPETIKN